MRFFTKTVKINPTFVASDSITIEAQRYRPSKMRWSASLNSGFYSYHPEKFIVGSLAEIKNFINEVFLTEKKGE